MKKLFFLSVLVLFFNTNLFSQFNSANLKAGAGLTFASNIGGAGLCIQGVYEIAYPWSAAVGFTHIFEQDYVNWNILDFEAQYYYYQINEGMNLYGIGGLSVTMWSIDIPGIAGFSSFSTSGSELGLNLGTGVDILLTSNLSVAPELKFTFMDGSYMRIGACLLYNF